jgi:hypothetical protein
MPNAIRGEAGLEAGGTSYRLVLTLGALADIEDGLGLADLSEIGTRLKHARAGDLAIVAAALIKAGGHDIAPAGVLALSCDLGTLVAAVAQAFDRAGVAGGASGSPFAGTISSPSG